MDATFKNPIPREKEEPYMGTPDKHHLWSRSISKAVSRVGSGHDLDVMG